MEEDTLEEVFFFDKKNYKELIKKCVNKFIVNMI